MEENYKELANAIIIQAVKDLRQITAFFCSQYFEGLTDLDGPRLLGKIIEKEMGADG